MTDTQRPTTRDAALAILTAPGEPYELTTIATPSGPVRGFKALPRHLGALYRAAASAAPFYVFGDERWSFQEALAAAETLAAALYEDYGVRRGDRVALSMRNYPEWALTFMATTLLGAVAVAMNALWSSEDQAFGLKDCGAKVFFADDERLQRLQASGGCEGLAVVAVRTPPPPGAAAFSALLQRPAPQVPLGEDVEPEDPAIIFYTSGSTGHPKGAVSSHRGVLSALLSWELDAAAGALLADPPSAPPPPPGVLLGIPLFHVTGSHAVFLSSFRAQRKIVAMRKWDAELAAELIERERLTNVVAPAAVTGDLVRVAQAGGRDLSSLVMVGGGGAPRAPEQVRQIGAAFGGALPNTGWGMTETNAIGVGIGGQDYLDHPKSSGRCSAVMELRIVDDHGEPVPVGARGELLVRGAGMFLGYWNRPDVNREVILEGGWFRTGDVAALDAEGYLYIVDRIKDLIIRGGENIGCGAVEAALLAVAGVKEAAVYAVPDDRLGEEVGATLYGEPGLDADVVRAAVAGALAVFERPRYVHISAGPLPRLASGKIDKRQLKAEAARRIAGEGRAA